MQFAANALASALIRSCVQPLLHALLVLLASLVVCATAMLIRALVLTLRLRLHRPVARRS